MLVIMLTIRHSEWYDILFPASLHMIHARGPEAENAFAHKKYELPNL